MSEGPKERAFCEAVGVRLDQEPWLPLAQLYVEARNEAVSSSVESSLLRFLKALEMAIPPLPGQHHAITYVRYGNDEKGWEDRLALRVEIGSRVRTLFLENDLERPVDEVIRVIKHVCGLPIEGHAESTGMPF